MIKKWKAYQTFIEKVIQMSYKIKIELTGTISMVMNNDVKHKDKTINTNGLPIMQVKIFFIKMK